MSWAAAGPPRQMLSPSSILLSLSSQRSFSDVRKNSTRITKILFKFVLISKIALFLRSFRRCVCMCCACVYTAHYTCVDHEMLTQILCSEPLLSVVRPLAYRFRNLMSLAACSYVYNVYHVTDILFFSAFASSLEGPINFIMCQSASIIAAATVRISVKSYIGDFYENLSVNSQIWLKSDKNIRHFT
jgi:hypothetical protein